LRLDLQRHTAGDLEEAARFYETNGFLLLDSIYDIITSSYDSILSHILGAGDSSFATVLNPAAPLEVFPPVIRQALSRVTTPPEFKKTLLDCLGPILIRLIGPLVHVSSNFHSQFKGGSAPEVDHGGYPLESNYMEVHGAYLLHQDFAGASFPTSPSMVTFWTALNTTKDWNLRLYAGSHRLGLLCNTWLNIDDNRVEKLGKPIDIAAKRGTAVLFNGMMLHGTSNPGPERRVSCDIRFFPLCGFLPSEVYSIDTTPKRAIEEGLQRADGPVLQSPLMEDSVFLFGDFPKRNQTENVAAHSILNWPNYLREWCSGNEASALPHLERLVNTEIGVDPPDIFVSKFHRYPICAENLQKVREQIS